MDSPDEQDRCAVRVPDDYPLTDAHDEYWRDQRRD